MHKELLLSGQFLCSVRGVRTFCLFVFYSQEGSPSWSQTPWSWRDLRRSCCVLTFSFLVMKRCQKGERGVMFGSNGEVPSCWLQCCTVSVFARRRSLDLLLSGTSQKGTDPSCRRARTFRFLAPCSPFRCPLPSPPLLSSHLISSAAVSGERKPKPPSIPFVNIGRCRAE